MTKSQHKLSIRKLLKATAFKELNEIQAGHIKVNSIVYKKPRHTRAKILFALRSHSIRGIKANFSSANKENIYCPLKCDTTPMIDEQRHLLVCKSICSSLGISQLEALKTTQYEDIDGTIHKQKEAVIVFGRLLALCQKLLGDLQTSPAAASGGTLVTAHLAS